MLNVYRLPALPRLARAAAWADLLSARLEPVDVSGFDPDVAPALVSGTLGPVELIRLEMGQCTMQRTPQRIGYSPDPAFSFLLQLSGMASFRHYGRTADLAPGDVTLCRHDTPYTYMAEGAGQVLLVRLPASVLKEHMPLPENFCGRGLKAGEGLCESTANLCRNLFEQLEAGVPPQFQGRVARNLVDALTTSFAMAFDEVIASSTLLNGLHARARLYIEENLQDPELSPRQIAEKLRVSPRYLRLIFADGNETASAYVLRRRVEECARQMADPASRDLSITEIAFNWGFNSAPHFARSFRTHFGVTPRDYRRRANAAAGAPA
jgi:AraC-like DNA-binding protein